MKKSVLFNSSVVIAGFTFVSKITGMFRDLILARAFGSSALVDAFFVALKIPNFFRRTLGEGSFVNAFIPIYTSHIDTSIEERRSILSQVSFTLALFVSLLCALIMLFAPLVILLFAPGFASNPAQFDSAVVMMRFTMPYLLFMSLSTVAIGILNSHGRFALGAFVPILFNASIVVAVLFFRDAFSVPFYSTCIAVSISGLLQWLILRNALRSYGYTLKITIPKEFPYAKKVMKLMLPSVVASSAYQLNALVDTIIASFLVTGSITWLYYGERMMQVPLGIFAVAVGTAVLPILSKSFSINDKESYYSVLAWGVRSILLIAVPSAIGLLVLAQPIIITLFYYGKFNLQDVNMSSLALIAYSAGLPALMLVKVYTSAWFSKHDSTKPMRAGFYSVGVHLIISIVLAFSLIWLFNKPIWLHVVLAGATSLGAVIHCFLLRHWLIQSERTYFSTHSDGWDIFGKIVVASVIMGSALWVFQHYLDFESAGFLRRLWYLFFLVLGGLLIFYASLKCLGIHVYHTLIDKKSN